MSLGLVGRKVGMTRIFAEDGASIPVTVLDVSNNRVTQIKTAETDGYSAVQVMARTLMKASCGTSTEPMAFILFLPSFCFSRSFFLRDISPP